MRVDGSHSHSFLVDEAKPLETDESKGDIIVFSISHPRMRGDGLVLSRKLSSSSFFLLPSLHPSARGQISQARLSLSGNASGRIGTNFSASGSHHLQSQILDISFLKPSFRLKTGPFSDLIGNGPLYVQVVLSTPSFSGEFTLNPGQREGNNSSFLLISKFLPGLGWAQSNKVNYPWLSVFSLKQLTALVTSEGLGAFPLFRLWVTVLFVDTLMYIQKSWVQLGPVPNHRPSLHSCPLYCVLCEICRGG